MKKTTEWTPSTKYVSPPINKIPKETNKALEQRMTLEKEKDRTIPDGYEVGVVEQRNNYQLGDTMQVYNFQKTVYQHGSGPNTSVFHIHKR